jgi:hypothetical protein
MKVTRVRIILMACVLLLALALPLSTVSASPPVVASGTFAMGAPTIIDMRFADGNIILDVAYPIYMYGDMDGIGVLESRVVIHSNGEVTYNGVCTFTGTVLGKAGTLVVRNAGHTTGGLSKGVSTILSGTGELANLRGTGTIQETAPGSGTYSGKYHFDPK